MRRTKRVILPPPPEANIKPKIKPTDCLKCIHGKPWKFGLIDCDIAITAVINCIDRKIECVNFKN